MQGAIGAFFSRAGVVKTTLLQHVRVLNPALRPLVFSRSESVSSAARIEEHGFEHTTISDVLSGKGKGADGSWLWCTTDDTVHDAVHSMTQHNVGALVVVKPGEQKSIAGIITERGNLNQHNPVSTLTLCCFKNKIELTASQVESVIVFSFNKAVE
ncbi:CBS domain-containing protein CBSX3, mitochondrial [Linum perenne]